MPKTITLYCQAGKHEWVRTSQRGRKPINCPDHQTGQDRQISDEQLQKMQEGRLRKQAEQAMMAQQEQEAIAQRIMDNVARYEGEDNQAYQAYCRARSDKNFTHWMRSNTSLLNAVTALRAHERRLTT